MKKQKISKEMNDIIEAITRWHDKNEGNVHFVGSFMVFDEKFDITEDRILCYGPKDITRMVLKDMDEEVEKEKGDFVNW